MQSMNKALGNAAAECRISRALAQLHGASRVFLILASGSIGSAVRAGTIPDGEANLPTVILEAKEPITGERERKTPCFVKILPPSKDTSGKAGPLRGVVRFHGATSQAYAKKSFAITLDAPAKLLDLRE